MRIRKGRRLVHLLIAVALFAPAATAQTSGDSDYNSERDKAVGLFSHQEYLQALPLFEDLAAKNPKDDKVLLGLAACLISHSATLDDMAAAGKERERAKELLIKARDLGNNSNLLQNLLEILQQLPESGKIQFSQNPDADVAMRAAEAAFARHDFDEAIKGYSKALDLDPKNSSAALFIGDSYYSKKDFARAGEWYARASQIDPNSETPYRYYADMLMQSGDMQGARTKAIQAVVADPYNPITWRALSAWANANHVALMPVHVNTSAAVSEKDANKLTLTVQAKGSEDATAAWTAYGIGRTSWKMAEFKKHFPGETEYRHSLPEEADALEMAASVWMLPNKDGKPKPADPDLDLLVKIYQAGMLEPYILLNVADEGIAKDYAAYREKNRAKLEQYLGTFVVPAVPEAAPK